MVATHVVEEGLKELKSAGCGQKKFGATPGGKRQTLAFRVPLSLQERLLQICEELPEASTPSAALHLVLWLGINRILDGADREGVAA